MENITSIPMEQIAIITSASVIILQGIKSQFKILNSKIVRLLQILIILWLLIAFTVENEVVKMFNSFVVIWLGGNGIYDFLPSSIKFNEKGSE